MLNASQVAAQVEILRGFHDVERAQLDVVRRYWKGRQAIPAVIPSGAPREVRTMARIGRVNICPLVISSLTQATFVDGFRGKNDDTDTESPIWQAWQANKMDARQTSIHRAAFAYGASYVVVTTGDPVPVIRPVSPRSMTAIYGEDPDWPMWALERCGGGLWKLYDDTHIYYCSEETREVAGRMGSTMETYYTFIESREHGSTVVPVVRYLDEDDLDDEDEVSSDVGDDQGLTKDTTTRGQIAPLMAIQDQIDLTTFGLLVAQWYSAFRQRYVIGWTAANEAELLKSSASQLWMFQDDSETEGGGVKVGEFGQTSLDGYIESRDASLKHVAVLSQTPVHELVGDLVNLSAEALAAADAGRDRKVDERKTLLGESHEQTLRLVGSLMKVEVPEDAEVIWRDTSARTFSATVDALGKLATMLGVPAQELWTRVPGVTQQDVERWKAAAKNGDAFAQLNDLIKRQDKTALPPAA